VTPEQPYQPGPAGSLPTAEQVAAHATHFMPQAGPVWVTHAPLIVLVAAVLLAILIPPPIGALLPWLALLGVLIHGSARLRGLRDLERVANAIAEQAMLRRYRPALRRAWLVLPRLVRHPSLHGRVVATMAHCLDDLGAHESAMAAYDHLLAGMPDAGPATMHVRISRAIAALRTDHLADGDEALRRSRGAIGLYLGTPIGGAFRMAQLVQDVRTHHYTDALEFAPTLVDDLRPLGIEAGFGYALMALCMSNARPADPAAAAQVEPPTRWWSRATTLLPAEQLVREFPELEPLARSVAAEARDA